MFEEYINIVKRNLLESLHFEQGFLFLDDILSNPYVHKNYKAYFKAEVEWWIYQEKLIRESHQNFDLTNDEITSLFHQYDSLLAKYAKFNHQNLIQLVDTAVKLRFNYLCRPRTTLKWFIYRGEPTKPLNEIIYRLNYFTDYDYLTDGFKSWLEDRKFMTSSKELLSLVEFEKIIERIDNDYILDLSPKKFNELLDPVFDLFFEISNHQDLTDINASETTPVEAVILFLDDKGITPLANSLYQELFVEKQIQFLSRVNFQNFIYYYLEKLENNSEIETDDDKVQNIQTNSTEFLLDDIQVEEDIIQFEELLNQQDATSLKIDDNSEKEISLSNERLNNVEIDDAILYDSFKEENQAFKNFENKNVIINESRTNDKFLERTFSDNYDNIKTIELYKSNLNNNAEIVEPDSNEENYNSAISIEKITANEFKPLSELITERLENKFIKKLFNRNTAKYFSLLNSLQHCRSWRDSASSIDKFFSENGIDPNSSLAVTFRNKIQERFL